MHMNYYIHMNELFIDTKVFKDNYNTISFLQKNSNELKIAFE